MVPVALALRQTLIELAGARQASEGQQTKMELVYQYLTGPRFRHRIEAIVERFSDMQADLERERKAMTRLWAKREEQLRAVMDATVGMYGDLQGIAGAPCRRSLRSMPWPSQDPARIRGPDGPCGGSRSDSVQQGGPHAAACPMIAALWTNAALLAAGSCHASARDWCSLGALQGD